MGRIAKDQRPHQIRPPLIERLSNQTANREAADDGILHSKQVKQPRKIGGMVLNRVRHLAEIGEAVAALVVKHDGKIAREPHDHVTPDTEIGAE